MAETKADWQPTGLERFSHLEDKIFRVVEAFKTVRKENETLRAENSQLKGELESLRNNENAVRESMAQLHEEREALRERVEKALNMLATLDAR